MKKLLLILFIMKFSVGFSQKSCPSGYSYMPSFSTSSLYIVADTCLPDSVCKSLMQTFRKNMCGEGGFAMVDENYYYSSIPKWINDSVGCVTVDKYQKKIKGKWVEISKCRYYYENKSSTSCMTTDETGKSETIPCCGHVHKTPPE